MIINNIGYLKQNLIDNGYHMTAFSFAYNHYHYDVLFENNDNIRACKHEYASVTLTFIDILEPERVLIVEANQKRIFSNPTEFRNYFHINFVENLGDLFSQFFNHFLKFVPKSVPEQLNDRQNLEIDHYLAGRNNHNPNAIYCFSAVRLGKSSSGKQKHRSIFISNLTQRRRPRLFDYFKYEETVTFYYSDNPAKELSDIEIINNFIDRYGIN